MSLKFVKTAKYIDFLLFREALALASHPKATSTLLLGEASSASDSEKTLSPGTPALNATFVTDSVSAYDDGGGKAGRTRGRADAVDVTT